MIEVTVDKIQVNLVSQSRVVILREADGDRFLPIWIGQFEAEAIAMRLQEVEAVRPMTHDLLKKSLQGSGIGSRTGGDPRPARRRVLRAAADPFRRPANRGGFPPLRRDRPRGPDPGADLRHRK